MLETTSQLVARVYSRLRGVSQSELPYKRVQEELRDVFKGYGVDEELSGKVRDVRVSEASLDEDDTDYILTLPDAPDYEPIKLEYVGFNSGSLQGWCEARTVSFESWREHFDADYVACAFYGADKVRVNLDPNEVNSLQWRMTYKLPLVYAAQLGENPPMPSDFLPMPVLKATILLGPQVNDDSEEWVKWWERTYPIYVSELREWDSDVYPFGRWQKKLNRSSEPQVMPIRPYNQHRHASVRTRGYVPRGS